MISELPARASFSSISNAPSSSPCCIGCSSPAPTRRREWRHGLVINGVADLDLHHLYRAMGWLGEELADQSGRGIGPRTTKDLVEERLFGKRNVSAIS